MFLREGWLWRDICTDFLPQDTARREAGIRWTRSDPICLHLENQVSTQVWKDLQMQFILVSWCSFV